MQEVVKYDPTKLMDAVRDRIKAEFVCMIPEDQWTKLVQAEVTAFFRVEDGYRSRYEISSFQKVVWEELEKETRKLLQTYFLSPGWSQRWGEHGEPLASQNAEELVLKLMPKIQVSIFGNICQQVVNETLTRLR